MKINPARRSRSLEGGILVYHRDRFDTWVVQWRSSVGRKYKTFKTLAQANFFASELQQERRRHGASPFPSLLKPEESQLWHEIKRLAGDTPLSEVLQAIKERAERIRGRQIGLLVDEFLALRKQEGVAGWLMTNQTLYLRRLLESVGPLKPANSIEASDIRKWAEALKSQGLGPKTIKHHLAVASMFFSRGIAEGWLTKNPCLAVQPPKLESKEVSVISAEDAAKLFAANRGRRVALYMALEAFGGLRFSSAFRLSRSDINLEEKTILLPAAKHKTGRRHLLEGLPENLWQWIRHADEITESSWKKNPWKISRVIYDREKREAFERAGIPKSCNVLRHSFCSYHVALHQDAARTALLMQHANQAMLYRHYRGVASMSDAKLFFGITPG